MATGKFDPQLIEMFYKISNYVYSRVAKRGVHLSLEREDAVQDMVIYCHHVTAKLLDVERPWWEVGTYYFRAARSKLLSLCRDAQRGRRRPEKEILSLDTLMDTESEPTECARFAYLDALPPIKRLTPDQVRTVRSHWLGGASLADLGVRFNRSRSTISRIVRGRSWKNV